MDQASQAAEAARRRNWTFRENTSLIKTPNHGLTGSQLPIGTWNGNGVNRAEYDAALIIDDRSSVKHEQDEFDDHK